MNVRRFDHEGLRQLQKCPLENQSLPLICSVAMSLYDISFVTDKEPNISLICPSLLCLYLRVMVTTRSVTACSGRVKWGKTEHLHSTNSYDTRNKSNNFKW